MSKLFKKDQTFFRLFGEMTLYILEAAEYLGEMFRNPGGGQHQILAAKIKDLEHKGDEATHHVIEELNKTFITPLDREDIHDLCLALDDVLDLIDGTAGRLVLFNISESIDGTLEMWQVLYSQAREIEEAVKRLKNNDNVIERCIEINRLENDADRFFQVAIGKLFENVKDPIEVIKRKEIIETLEKATDMAEDVANVLETIIVKNA
jgi:predicted phosphate transport protein (TIGR00153 family)